VTVNLKKVLTWLLVAFVIFYIIQAPEKSAEMVKTAGGDPR
jgi:large-conductance mechanosensitive channel